MQDSQLRGDGAFIEYVRARDWAQTEAAHDEIARLISRSSHMIDQHLSPIEKAYVRAGAKAAMRRPRPVLRFGLLEDALERVSLESDGPPA